MKTLRWIAIPLMLGTNACNRAESQGGNELTLEAKLPAQFAQLSNVVELSDGRLMFADTFLGNGYTLQFTRTAGRITGFEATNQRMRRVKFTRRP